MAMLCGFVRIASMNTTIAQFSLRFKNRKTDETRKNV